ncbi:DOPA 4,5-dioxygenase family protein [Enterovibrio norvegicus]|uniref:DOPA 4,5-dioxygenase family protein n=1 Tax=Enterovibrio norvegicus TaxID=188144 RepID=UPI0003080B43|nr:DOPA 4,5-dioxygenase family protein [Enterovibrio norvegicus]OEF56262.1 4,5-dioxygenase [Enterovibrio norvegicus]
MDSPKRPINNHEAYHAHVYFDESTLDTAKHLHQKIQQNFPLKLGRIHERPVGPQTMWSYQVLFFNADFDRFIPWLDEERKTLNVLVHASIGDDLADHTKHAYWLGDTVELDLRGF